MSEIRSRPRVHSVAVTVMGPATCRGLTVAGRLLESLVPSLTPSGCQAFRDAVPGFLQAPEGVLKPGSVVRSHFQARQHEALRAIDKQKLEPAEAIRVSALLALAATPFHLESDQTLIESWAALKQARSLGEARRVQQRMLALVESSHHRLFVSALTQACENACREIGFGAVETASAPGGAVRVIATDPAGRTLVTEIQGSANAAPQMATEVVGISDGSCHEILDAFDRALEAQGVRAGPVQRKFTGGVCQLETARQFVRRKVQKGSLAVGQGAAGSGEQAIQRARRLNTARPARIQQRG